MQGETLSLVAAKVLRPCRSLGKTGILSLRYWDLLSVELQWAGGKTNPSGLGIVLYTLGRGSDWLRQSTFTA
jgi:hypothetical protein